ncbi:unnamed protein product [Cylicocyclus nassatus]|uniref:Uncharacterized protein n=1 Tax=Cylicocyclus nassatus TaxID=53992 RepID=A0AA36HCK8_CYLNA|nr:unnamed protein product [Cylicocyclus nassatus]
MSLLGSYKARITKAANALRKEITEVNEALNRWTLPRRQSEKAEEFARQHPDEQGEFPYLQQIQSHWDASELDQLLEEADILRLRLDVVIKLLPSSEALYSFHAPTVPPSFSSVTFSPHPAQDPSSTHQQPAQDVRAEIRSHSSSHDQDRPSEPVAAAPADTLLPARASSASQGFGIPSDDPS